MLTLDQADKFLSTHLNFSNWKQVLETNKLEFLRLFVRKHATYIPYQNITLASIIPEKRRSPTNAEIIADGISGKGGVCFVQNHFAKIILDTIGFDTYAIEGHCPLTPFPGDHYIFVVTLNGEQYLVDFGILHPNYDILPLDPVKLPFRASMFGFPYEYRYSKETDTYHRVHILGGVNNGRFKNKDEDIFCIFNLTPKQFGDYYEAMTKVYSDQRSFTLRTFFISRFLELSDEEMRKEDANPGFVFIHGSKLVVGDRTTREETDFKTYEQVVPTIIKYFPMLIPEEIEKAIDTFTKCGEKNLHLKNLNV